MGNIFLYSAITAKIHAIQKNLLSIEDFHELADTKSVSDALSVLKRNPAYSPFFSSNDITQLHRAEIERILLISKFNDFSKLYRFANLKQRKFLQLYFMNYEISILKRCLRSCINKRALDINIDTFNDFFKKHSKLDFEALSKSKSISDFIDGLKGSIYYEPLYKLKNDSLLFDYELNIDLIYFKTVWKNKNLFLSKSEKDTISACLGTKLDLLNIQWIYRSKKYYSLPDTALYSLLIPTHYRLNEKEIKDMVESSDLTSFYEVLDKTYYGKIEKNLFLEKPTLESLAFLVLSKIHKLRAKKDPYSIACINSYLYHKEDEIRKIINIIESVRYSIPKEKIMYNILQNNKRRTLA